MHDWVKDIIGLSVAFDVLIVCASIAFGLIYTAMKPEVPYDNTYKSDSKQHFIYEYINKDQDPNKETVNEAPSA